MKKEKKIIKKKKKKRKEINQLSMSYFNLHEILPALLKKGNIGLFKVLGTVDHQILI